MGVVLRFDKAFPAEEWLALYKTADYNAWWTERKAVAALDYAYLVTTAAGATVMDLRAAKGSFE